MAGINHIRRWVMGQMTKKADDGIMITLPDSKKVDLNVSITMDRLIRNGINPNEITNPQQVDNAINMINSRMVNRAIPADSAEGREITEKLFGKQKAPVFDMEGNRIPEGSGIMGGKSVKDLMESGQVTKGARGMKKSKKVQDREMFKAANERLTSDVNSIIKDIKSMEPITAMKEANSVIARKGKYKNLTQEQSKKILQDTEDHIFERNLPEDPEDFAAGGVAGLLGERPRYQTGGDVAFDASDASIFGSNAITVTPETVADAFGNQVQQEMGNTYNPPLIEDVIEEKNNIEQEGTLIPEQGGGRPPGGNQDSGITTLPNGTVYNPGRPIVPPEIGGGRPIGGGPSPYEGPMKTQEQFGANAFFRNQEDFNNAYQDYVQKYKEYQGGGRPPGGGGSGITTLPDGTVYNPGRPMVPGAGAATNLPGSGAPGTGNLMDGFKNFITERYGDGPMISTADTRSYTLPDGTVQQGSSTSIGRINEYLKSIGQPEVTYNNSGLGGLGGLQTVQPGPREGGKFGRSAIGNGFYDLNKNSLGSPLAQAAMANGGRAGFMAGGMGRRGFLKLLAGAGAGIGALKSGLVNILGKGTGKEVAKEVVQQSGAGSPPPYFFKLVDKIKTLGDDVTEVAATTDREVVKKYKDFEMSEDVATGQIVIKKRNEGVFYDQDGIISDEYIVYKPGQADEVTKMKTVDEYDEYTIRPDSDGKLTDAEDGLDSIDEILQEVGDQVAPIKNQTMNQTKSIKKASGGIARMLGE